jgi:uncharacterized protein YeaO (DUF488 family)
MKPDIRLKRAYEEAGQEDGCRILVDGIWPRGVTKEKAGIDYWPKSLAPSKELRKWFGHDPEKWEAFQEKYAEELEQKPEAVAELIGVVCSHQRATFVFGSREERFNNAAALKGYIEKSADCEK